MRSLITPPPITEKAQAVLRVLEGLSLADAAYVLQQAQIGLNGAIDRVHASQTFSLAQPFVPPQVPTVRDWRL